jgi:hypothetical protein
MRWFVLIAAIAYVLQRTPATLIEGTYFKARKVIIMVDRSGSMGGTESRLAAQLELLRGAGIVAENLYRTRGFGLSPLGNPDNLLYPLKDALRQTPDADAIYVFSDFSHDAEWVVDGSDEAGYQQLREMLTEHRMRLYLGTVSDDPSSEFAAIASNSGGAVIRAAHD